VIFSNHTLPNLLNDTNKLQAEYISQLNKKKTEGETPLIPLYKGGKYEVPLFKGGDNKSPLLKGGQGGFFLTAGSIPSTPLRTGFKIEPAVRKEDSKE
jgi:hypothetical protein